MKTIIQIFTGLFLTLAVVNCSSSKEAASNLETVEINTTAQCGMCKETIEKAMAYERGIKEFNLDVDSKVLTVTYNPKKTNPDKIRQAVAKVGYDADDVKADERAYDNLPACCQKGGHD